MTPAPRLNVGLFFSPFAGKSGEINPAVLLQHPPCAHKDQVTLNVDTALAGSSAKQTN